VFRIFTIRSELARSKSLPSPRLTPAAARTVDRDALCNFALPKNRVTPAELRERVFQAYSIAYPDPAKYEVGYPVTPAAGASTIPPTCGPSRTCRRYGMPA
jgi:hypothetical protein